MRVNMKPEVMTREVMTVIAAQVQRLFKIGAMKRIIKRNEKKAKANVPQRAQSIGAL